MSKEVYFVTGIRNKESSKLIGTIRCWGYFFDLELAKEDVKNNTLDIAEDNYYNYLVIEKIPSGICPIFKGIEEVQWYKHDPSDNKYKECEKPEWSTSCCQWALS